MPNARRSTPLLLTVVCLSTIGCGSSTGTTTEHVTTPAMLVSLIRQSYRIADAQARDGRFPAPQRLARTLGNRLEGRHVSFVLGGTNRAYGDQLVIDTRSRPDRLLIEGRVGAIVAQAFQQVGELPVVRYIAVRHWAPPRDTQVARAAFEDGFWVWLAVFARGPSEPFSVPLDSYSTSYANPAQTAIPVPIGQDVDASGVPAGVEDAANDDESLPEDGGGGDEDGGEGGDE